MILNKISSVQILDGVKITTYENGDQTFELVDETPVLNVKTEKSWWQKIKDWWNNSDIKPYAKIRDLSDPIGKRKEDPFDDGSGSKKAAEIGIKIEF